MNHHLGRILEGSACFTLLCFCATCSTLPALFGPQGASTPADPPTQNASDGISDAAAGLPPPVEPLNNDMTFQSAPIEGLLEEHEIFADAMTLGYRRYGARAQVGAYTYTVLTGDAGASLAIHDGVDGAILTPTTLSNGESGWALFRGSSVPVIAFSGQYAQYLGGPLTPFKSTESSTSATKCNVDLPQLLFEMLRDCGIGAVLAVITDGAAFSAALEQCLYRLAAGEAALGIVKEVYECCLQEALNGFVINNIPPPDYLCQRGIDFSDSSPWVYTGLEIDTVSECFSPSSPIGSPFTISAVSSNNPGAIDVDVGLRQPDGSGGVPRLIIKRPGRATISVTVKFWWVSRTKSFQVEISPRHVVRAVNGLITPGRCGAGGGSTELAVCGGRTVCIRPDPVRQGGKRFDRWTGTINSTVERLEIEVQSDIAVEAIFTQRFNLTVQRGSGSGEYDEGQIVPISAESAPDGLEFDRWTGSGITDPTSPNTSVLMDADKTVTATFRCMCAPLTVTAVIVEAVNPSYNWLIDVTNTSTVRVRVSGVYDTNDAYRYCVYQPCEPVQLDSGENGLMRIVNVHRSVPTCPFPSGVECAHILGFELENLDCPCTSVFVPFEFDISWTENQISGTCCLPVSDGCRLRWPWGRTLCELSGGRFVPSYPGQPQVCDELCP